MSEIKKKLLEPSFTKKQVIWVVVTAGLLVTGFAFSAYFFSLIAGTQRDEPSDEYDTAEYENAKELTPHYPVDLDDLLDWLEDDYDLADLEASLEDLEDLGVDVSDISPQDLQDLLDQMTEEEIEQFVNDMMDGDVDNYNLAIAGLAIAALLFSEVEAFRIYNYPQGNFQERESILWKYECYDQFNGYEWVSTVPMESRTYPESAGALEENTIQKSLSVIQGANSMVLGTRFNEIKHKELKPSILKDSFGAKIGDAPFPIDEVMYFYDDLDCSSVDLIFDEAGNINMTYLIYADVLSSNDDVNNTAVGTVNNPIDPDFQDFLQLPGGVSNYIDDNYYFRTHRNNLVGIINPNDNAFVVANKIRNYLQSNFDYTFDALVNDAPGDTEDVVEWFCEHGEGMSSEFASAFVAFARSFGVGARYVDGFNSRLIEEFNDTYDKLYYPIKYKNIYNWAEVYIPTQLAGKWVQMDVLYDSFGEGGAPVGPEMYNISILANSTIYKRGELANITAVLSSDLGEPINLQEIIFSDLTTGRNLGSKFTDINGKASIEVPIETINHIVGPNVIEASYLNVENETYYIVDDEIRVDFISASPQEVNVSESDPRTWAIGYIRDNTTNRGVPNAEINFVLLYKGTTIPYPNPFVDDIDYTTSIGYFNRWLTVNQQVDYGEYDLRADFIGNWTITVNDEQINVNYPNINHTSDTIDFNVTKEFSYDLLFSINGRPTEYPNDPNPGTLLSFNRYNQLNFSARVLDADDGTPVPDVLVEFYDYTNGHILIGSDVSDSYGNASILYTIGDTNKSGPCLVYAKLSTLLNYSYYIVNEPINIDFILGPSPNTVNIEDLQPQFNVQCQLLDNFNNPINNSEIDLRMFRGGFEYTNFLTPINPDIPNPSGSNYFDIDRDVNPSTPAENYTLRLDFNGTFDFTNYPYPYFFDLNYFSSSFGIATDLRVYDPQEIQIYISVEGNHTTEFYDENYSPQKYERGEIAHFQVNITQSGSPATNPQSVTIYDDYSGDPLANHHYIPADNGFVQFDIPTNKFYHAGIHRIRVQLDTYAATNYTYIIINETVSVYASSTIQTTGIDNVVIRDNGGFVVNGWIMENNTELRGLIVRLVLFNKTNDNVSYYLIGNSYAVTDANGNFTIQIDEIAANAPIGEYYIRVDFNGSIYISETPGIFPIGNYMDLSSCSNPVPLNITSHTVITQIDLYSDLEAIAPDQWIIGDILHVLGNLTWDDNSILANMYVNVTVQLLDGTVIDYNDTVKTDGSGDFHGLITVNLDWPTDRSDTRIVVYFDPEIPANNLQFAEKTNTIFT